MVGLTGILLASRDGEVSIAQFVRRTCWSPACCQTLTAAAGKLDASDRRLSRKTLMAEPPLPGACFCGAVRYRLTRMPMFVHCCHCLDCQAQTGGALAINAIIERGCVEITAGEPVRTTVPTDSGRFHDVWRCPDCHTALWSDYGRREVIVFVRVSTLEARHEIAPDVHIFTRSKVPWVGLPDGARAYEVYYDMGRLWPAESLERRRRALGQA
jgi:hypothetical protein